MINTRISYTPVFIHFNIFLQFLFESDRIFIVLSSLLILSYLIAKKKTFGEVLNVIEYFVTVQKLSSQNESLGPIL